MHASATEVRDFAVSFGLSATKLKNFSFRNLCLVLNSLLDLPSHHLVGTPDRKLSVCSTPRLAGPDPVNFQSPKCLPPEFSWGCRQCAGTCRDQSSLQAAEPDAGASLVPLRRGPRVCVELAKGTNTRLRLCNHRTLANVEMKSTELDIFRNCKNFKACSVLKAPFHSFSLF